LRDPLGLPDSFFSFYDTLVIFDHVYQSLKVVSHYRSESTDPEVIEYQYRRTVEKIRRVLNVLQTDHTPSVPQGEIHLNQTYSSNVGKAGYETFVTQLKQHIKDGDIIQAVPSQRLTRPTNLHPFNVYRHLRTLNPSPYMFYIDLKDYQIVGASPELLVKVENDMVYTHPIAGTRRRGKTKEGTILELFSTILFKRL
jgi:anthranilate synthase component 1